MKKRIMAFFVSLALVLQCIAIPLVIKTKAEDDESYAVATPIVEMETLSKEVIYNQKLSNFTAAFDYTETETSGFKLSYDYDSNLKKTVYSENFEDYNGDFVTTQLENHGIVVSVPDWQTYNIAEIENDFSVTAFIAMQNRDWGQMKLYLKEDLYLSLVGKEHGENALFLQLVNRDSVIGSFDLKTITENLHMIDSGSYIKVTLEGKVVKVALSTDITVSEDETVFTAELPENNFTTKNSVGIWQGNTGLYFDDITIIDLTQSGYETKVTEIYTYKEIYSENFDSEGAIAPEYTTLADDGNGGKMIHSAHWSGEAVICDLSKNYRLEFSALSKNPDWDNKYLNLGNGIELHISGKMISSDGLYTLRLLKDGNEIAKDINENYICEANNNFRIDYNNGLIEVYISSSNKFSAPVLSATVDTSADNSEKNFKIYGGESLYIDNIAVKDLDDYTVDVNTKITGKYGAVQLKDGKISVLEINGSTETEKASVDFSPESDKKYRFAISRDKDRVSVSVDEKNILNADVRFDSENYMGEVMLNSSAGISDIAVYDSGRITFTDGKAILNSYALSDKISALAKSNSENSIEFKNNTISANITDVNGTVHSSAWMKEEAGDMVLEFDINTNRSDWTEDRFYFAVSGDINPASGETYQWEPEKLYKNGYSLTFGAETENSFYYNANSLAGGIVTRLSSDNVSISEHWGNTTKTVRIVRKMGEIKVYLYSTDNQPILIEKIANSDYLKGNIYWYHRQGNSQISDISVFDTENYEIVTEDNSDNDDTSSDDTSSDNTSSDDTSSDNTSSDDTSSGGTSSDDELIEDGKTELLKFYNTTKTDEKLFVNKPATYEVEGPWYKITNPHANAMYLEKSLIGDTKVSDMDMSFTYYASGYWMTNEFYFGSTDKYGRNGFVLRMRGEGAAGDSGYNVELLKKNDGEYEQLSTANIPNITDGAYCFHMTVKDGNITVNIRAKNAKEEEAYTLKGQAKDVYGGIYMYMYDDCTVRLRDIVIYKGTDIKNAEQPDLSVEKTTLLETDFSDGKAPVELFSEKDTGVTLEVAEEKLHFNTNGNNYMQIGGFVKDDWLEDFTTDFDYQGHRGDWNIDRFGWHTERKNGDLYNSVYLSVLGNEISSDKKHAENYAKVEGANIQLISSRLGKKECIGYASIPEINNGKEYTFRIAVEDGNISVWVWEKGKDMPEKATIEAFEAHPALSYGDFFVHAWSSDFSLDNMKIVNYADYTLSKGDGSSDDKPEDDKPEDDNSNNPEFDGKTELLKFYNTTKTDEKLFVNKPATYEVEGPWYKITNPHANAMHLEKSLIGDVKVNDMDMSFTYYASGYWMTNEFYFGSYNKYGDGGFVLRVKGEGAAGDSGYNVELLKKNDGEYEQLSTANIPNITDGAYCFHITVKDGNITVNIRAKNAKEEETYTLKGEAKDVYGGIYMYMYDDCTVRLRDIVIYKGTDIKNAEQPDLSVEKTILLETDFSDGKAPVELFSEKDTGVTLEVAEEKLHFNTNGNNYMQIGGFAKDDWLEDFTTDFDYQGHRGDWNIDRFGWHTERKNGDLYNSVYLSVLGNEISSDKKHAENYAKVEGANIQLISSRLGKKECIGYVSIPEINNGKEYTFRIAVEDGNILVWAWEKGKDMPEKATIEAFEAHPALSYGDLFVHAWSSDFSLDNMRIVNYADYTLSKGDGSSDDKPKDDNSNNPEFDGKTELLKFYNTEKTDEKLFVNKPATYEVEGPWYKITNPHGNAMYLEKSLIGDVKVSDMDMSFTYYASGYWMTNEFFFGSTDKHGRNGFVLRMRGEGTAGDSGYNVELLINDNGKYKQLSTANILNLTDGAYCFHITVKDGNITVNIRAKNAKEEDAYILKGESQGVYGGIYMYMYDDCTVRLRDIVIYKGTDIKNAEQPDLSEEKTTLLETDFSDGKAPVELFSQKDTGVTLEVAEERLHFNTNHNNYMQIGGFAKDDWLEDFTAEFDYLGYRGDWNITRFGWHTERKDGDLYSSVYLSVLGSNISADKNHVDNYAKVEDANVQLISSQFGVKTCIGYASIPDIDDGREYTLRIAVEDGNISVWAWAAGSDMPEKAVIKSFEPHPTLSYGDFFVHAWCSDFSLDNMKIVNFADYTIPEPTSSLNQEIGEIFRVDRIFEKIKEDKEDNTDTTPVIVEESKFPILAVIIPVSVIASAVVIFLIILIVKKRRKKV